VLADYERVGVLTHGAHSTVWKGFDPALKRDVALKHLTAEDAAVAAQREGSVLAGLKHPNIVAVYDVFDDDGVWLIEQWISGASLSAVLAQTGKLRAIDALALVHGALSGLAYAHGREVVHGDVAPSNILIDSAGTPMLVDFGLAVTPGQTSLGGTPGYMAPEAAAGKAVDKRSDVYSSCVVLAELLKGAKLFPESSLAATYHQSIGAPKLDGIEAPVAAVLSTGLDTAPDQRHPDAAVLLADLEDAIEKTHGRGWLAGAGLGAIGSTAATIAAGSALTGTTSATTTSATTPSTTATASKSTTSTLSRGKLLAAGATVAAIIIAVIAFLLARPTPPPQPIAGQSGFPRAGGAAAPLALPSLTYYRITNISAECNGIATAPPPLNRFLVEYRGDSVVGLGGIPGATRNADGSYVASDDWFTYKVNISSEGGRSVIHGVWINAPGCAITFEGTEE
jgi:hypothetical protein